MNTVQFIGALFLYFLIVCQSKRTAYLSLNQLKSISSLIQHTQLPDDKKVVVRRVLYTQYESWAIHQSYLFSRTYPKHVLKSVGRQTLVLSAKIGLHKSTLNYDGRAPFAHYAKFYIRGELSKIVRKHMSALYEINSIHPDDEGNDTDYVFNNAKSLSLSPDTMFSNREIFSKLWIEVGKQPSVIKQMIMLKYDPFFQVHRSNVDISKIMGYSEEHVRRTIVGFFTKIHKIES